LIEKNLIADFFGETKAEERQFAHIEAMIKTFMNPIDEMEEEKEEDTPAQPSVIYEPEIRLQFDDDLDLNDSPLPKIKNFDFVSVADEEVH